MKITARDFVFAGIIVILVFLLYRFNKNLEPGEDLIQITKIDKKKPDIIKDSNGNIHASKQIITVQDPRLVATFKLQIDSLTKQLQLKNSEIKVMATAASQSNLTFKPDIQKIIDSVKGTIYYEVNYKSKWFDLKGRVPSNEPFEAIQRDSITLAFIEKRSGLLNLKRTYTADIHSANQNMQYYNLRAWEKLPKQRSRIGLGITVGYGAQYNTKVNNFSLGPQITGGLQFRF